MVKALAFTVSIAALAGCSADSYRQPISFPPMGAAVHANMAAQIVDPPLPAAAWQVLDGQRAVARIKQYRAGEQQAPTTVQTSSAVNSSPQG